MFSWNVFVIYGVKWKCWEGRGDLLATSTKMESLLECLTHLLYVYKTPSPCSLQQTPIIGSARALPNNLCSRKFIRVDIDLVSAKQSSKAPTPISLRPWAKLGQFGQTSIIDHRSSDLQGHCQTTCALISLAELQGNQGTNTYKFAPMNQARTIWTAWVPNCNTKYVTANSAISWVSISQFWIASITESDFCVQIAKRTRKPNDRTYISTHCTESKANISA